MTQPRPDGHRPERARPLLDIAGCADYIGSSIRHVRRMVAERTIPHYKVGHYIRFDPDELDEWLRRHRRGPHDGLPPPDPGTITTRRRSAQTAPSKSSPRSRLDG